MHSTIVDFGDRIGARSVDNIIIAGSVAVGNALGNVHVWMTHTPTNHIMVERADVADFLKALRAHVSGTSGIEKHETVDATEQFMRDAHQRSIAQNTGGVFPIDAERPIAAGDVVRLKSGSPPMTVTSVTANASADVAWFEHAPAAPMYGRACANTYPVAALERVPTDDETARLRSRIAHLESICTSKP